MNRRPISFSISHISSRLIESSEKRSQHGKRTKIDSSIISHTCNDEIIDGQACSLPSLTAFLAILKPNKCDAVCSIRLMDSLVCLTTSSRSDDDPPLSDSIKFLTILSRTSRTFFIIAVFFFHRLASGCVAHPLFFAAVEAVLLDTLQLKVFVTLVERHQEQFLAFSPPAKRENEIKTKFFGKATQDDVEHKRYRLLR